MPQVLVVGGGLGGLTAANALHEAGMAVTVAEARPFVGGRMMTVTPEGLGDNAWFDAGLLTRTSSASWMIPWPKKCAQTMFARFLAK